MRRRISILIVCLFTFCITENLLYGACTTSCGGGFAPFFCGCISPTGNFLGNTFVAACGSCTPAYCDTTYGTAACQAVPTASSVSISGALTIGNAVTGSYAYSDADGDSEGASTYKWYTGTDNACSDKTDISGATDLTYTIQAADANKFLCFGITPVASAGTSPGAEVIATTASAVPAAPPSLILNSLSSITGSTVLASATATGTGIGERGFYWWIPPTTATHFGGSESGLIPEGYGAGSFSLKLTGLKPGNNYRVKAYVKVGGQIITSDEQIFTTATTGATGKTAPTVLTDTVNYTVSGSSITVSGEITDIGSSAVNVYGFVYAPHTAPFTGDDMLKTGDRAYAMWDKTPLYQGMKFTGTVKNIPPGKWYLRTYAHNVNPDSDAAQTASLGYGEEISFTIACTPETCIPGDVNGDGKVSLDDAMLVLRILAGIPVGNVNLNADVNGDGKIGLEELGYILQKVAELRSSAA